MSLLDALSNSMAGVSAQSFALDTISGNIANASTAGFKSTETSFADMLGRPGPAGSRAASRSAPGRRSASRARWPRRA